MLRAGPHFLLKYLKNSLKSLTPVKSKLPNQSTPCFAVQNGKIGKAFSSCSKDQSDYISTPTPVSKEMAIALLPSKNVWNQTTDAAEQR